MEVNIKLFTISLLYCKLLQNNLEMHAVNSKLYQSCPTASNFLGKSGHVVVEMLTTPLFQPSLRWAWPYCLGHVTNIRLTDLTKWRPVRPLCSAKQDLNFILWRITREF